MGRCQIHGAEDPDRHPSSLRSHLHWHLDAVRRGLRKPMLLQIHLYEQWYVDAADRIPQRLFDAPNNPTPAGQCIIAVAGLPFALGVLNTSAPFSSPVIFNLRAHYDWQVGGYHPFAWVGVSHTGASSNEPANYPDGNAAVPAESTLLRYTIPAYTTYDAALGVARDNWTAQLTGSNLSNSDAATNLSSAPFIRATIPMRPRVLTLLFSHSF
jgi:iron complex outermembrane recepter protein